MNTIPEELQKHFDEAQINLQRARAAYINMATIEEENEEGMLAGTADLLPYKHQEEFFIHALGQTFKRVLEIHEFYVKPQDAREGIAALQILLKHALE